MTHSTVKDKPAGRDAVRLDVTSKGVTQAPGSPHGITNLQNLIVLPTS